MILTLIQISSQKWFKLHNQKDEEKNQFNIRQFKVEIEESLQGLN